MSPNLAVGVRFLPTDEDLINHYLKPKMAGKDGEVDKFIAEIDLCKHQPWELPGIANKLLSANKLRREKDVWFFFYKYSKSKRANRTTKTGFWKLTGKPREVKAEDSGEVIGRKRFVSFYRKNDIGSSKGNLTEWTIHEYHAKTTPSHQSKLVVCKVMKTKAVKKTDGLSRDRGESRFSMTRDVETHAANRKIAAQSMHNDPVLLDKNAWIRTWMPMEQGFPDGNLPVADWYNENTTASTSKVHSSEDELDLDKFVDNLLDPDSEMNWAVRDTGLSSHEGLVSLNDENTGVRDKQRQANPGTSSASDRQQEHSIQPADNRDVSSISKMYMARLVREFPVTRKRQNQRRLPSREPELNCITIKRDEELAERFTNLRIDRELNGNTRNQVQHPKTRLKKQTSADRTAFLSLGTRETDDNRSNYCKVHSSKGRRYRQ